MQTVLLAAVLVVFLTVPPAETARAQSNGEITQVEMIALNNFHHEIAGCVVYYSIAIEALKQRGAEEAATFYQGLSDTSLGSMLIIGRKIGMKDETTTARIRMEFDRQMEQMGETLFNFSILLEKYLDACKVVSDDPESRIIFWMDQATADSLQ